MAKKIALIHANLDSVQPMIEAFKRLAPDVSRLNFMDEGLLQEVNEQGKVTPQILRKFINFLGRAEDMKVDGILLSCSVFSPFIEQISPLYSVPVEPVDRAMLEQAVEMGTRIGVIATVATAGPTTAKQLEEFGLKKGKKVDISLSLALEAFKLLQADPDSYDSIISEKAKELDSKVDAIVLAQISMSRALPALGDIKVPILTSPESSVKAILKKLG